MTLDHQNRVLIGILDILADQMGRTGLEMAFEDFGMPESLEPYFDGMVCWARDEELIRLENATDLGNASAERSFASLHNPAITSRGVMVASIAMQHLDGNVVLAAGMARHPDLSHLVRGKPAAARVARVA